MNCASSFRMLFATGVCMAAWLGGNDLPAARADEKAPQPVDFAHDVLPLLKARCAKCHTAGTYKGKLSFDTRAALLATQAVVPGNSGGSPLLERITSTDAELRMPPTGDPLSAAEIAIFKRWIDEGVAWQEGFSFAAKKYVAPLALQAPALPPAREGRTHPLDRLIDEHWHASGATRPEPLSDAAFLRRVSLDLVGLLPEPEDVAEFVADRRADKHEQLIESLLARDADYAGHWLTFWNDLLRNDYEGPGYIDGGRKQITAWLYGALLANKPYNEFTRELINPSPASEGFIFGIKWRGNVNASQVREVQFAQNVGQVFLGVNLKCASCHDSFIDDWKLREAYALAAVVSDKPLEIHRCDKPTGEMAVPGFLFPQLGTIDPALEKSQRLNQLAQLLTQPANGRFARTIVNRLWHRTMGRGIVHPVDVMGNEPWSEKVLDYLAVDHVAHGYNIKHTLALICSSHAYRSQSVVLSEEPPAEGFVFQGPLAKRLTAEQFLDAAWQLTGASPTRIDAPLSGIKAPPRAANAEKKKKAERPAGSLALPSAQWIWREKNASATAPGQEKLSLRRVFTLARAPQSATLAVTCDNEYTLFLNGERIAHDDDWQTTEQLSLASKLRAGENELLAVVANHTDQPNPAGFYLSLAADLGTPPPFHLISDGSWQVSRALPSAQGKFASPPTDWQPAQAVANQQVWESVLAILAASRAESSGNMPDRVRAALVKSTPLLRSLGRPQREQVVTTRPDDLSTLQALDLANDQGLYDLLLQGARNLKGRIPDAAEQVAWLYQAALCREPSAAERAIALDLIGTPATEEGLADLFWAVFMLPEFQLVQ